MSEKTQTLTPLTLEAIFHLDHLYPSYKVAFKGKNYRPRYLNFRLSEGSGLLKIQREVLSNEYQTKPPHKFIIFCNCGQKAREIHASAIPDIIAQRAIYEALYPVFDKSFIYDNYGCRKGKGTQKAADRTQQFIRESPESSYYLQLDVRKFYYNIDHAILRGELAKKISDQRLLDLCMQFVCTEPNELTYEPFATGVGLDVGAMISQLYGLIYLNRLDHFIKRTLKVKRYIRYVDDMVIIGETKERCIELRDQIARYLDETLHLKLSAADIQPLKRGVNFVGFRTWRTHRLVRKFCIRNFRRRLRQGETKILSMQAMLAHARHSASFGYMARTLIESRPDLIMEFRGRIKHDLLKYQTDYIRSLRNRQGLQVQPAKS